MGCRAGRRALTSILADTHALIWLLDGSDGLGQGTRDIIDQALVSDSFHVSAITFWEVSMLAVKGRIRLKRSPEKWRRAVLDLGIVEIPFTGDIAVAAATLKDFHGDPADRFITATAMSGEAVLVTADRRILSWQGEVNTWNAGN